MATVRKLTGNDAFIEALHQTVTFALQPIVDLRTGETLGVEALIRNLDKLGFRSISAFFDYAWSAGILAQVDRLLCSQALAQIAVVPALSGRKIFLNIDSRAFAHRDGYAGESNEILRRIGIEPDQVVLESRFMDLGEPFGGLDQGLSTCRDNGFGLAIDNFGRGLGELRVFFASSPEYVKIDPFFTAGAIADERKRRFIGALVNFTHSLKSQAIAKGVESSDDVAVFRDAGCDFAQGFWIAGPTMDHETLKPRYPHIAM